MSDTLLLTTSDKSVLRRKKKIAKAATMIAQACGCSNGKFEVETVPVENGCLFLMKNVCNCSVCVDVGMRIEHLEPHFPEYLDVSFVFDEEDRKKMH